MRKIIKENVQLLINLVVFFMVHDVVALFIFSFLLKNSYLIATYEVRLNTIIIIGIACLIIGILITKYYYRCVKKQNINFLQIKYFPVLIIYALFAYWFGYYSLL